MQPNEYVVIALGLGVALVVACLAAWLLFKLLLTFAIEGPDRSLWRDPERERREARERQRLARISLGLDP